MSNFFNIIKSEFQFHFSIFNPPSHSRTLVFSSVIYLSFALFHHPPAPLCVSSYDGNKARQTRKKFRGVGGGGVQKGS